MCLFLQFHFHFLCQFPISSLIWRDSHAKRFHLKMRGNIKAKRKQSENRTKIGANEILKTMACAQKKHCCDSNGFLPSLSISARLSFSIDESVWTEIYTHIYSPSAAETLLSCSCFPFFLRSLLTNTFYEYKFSMSIRSIMSLLSNYFLYFLSHPFALVRLYLVFVAFYSLCSYTHFQRRILIRTFSCYILRDSTIQHSFYLWKGIWYQCHDVPKSYNAMKWNGVCMCMSVVLEKIQATTEQHSSNGQRWQKKNEELNAICNWIGMDARVSYCKMDWVLNYVCGVSQEM